MNPTMATWMRFSLRCSRSRYEMAAAAPCGRSQLRLGRCYRVMLSRLVILAAVNLFCLARPIHRSQQSQSAIAAVEVRFFYSPKNMYQWTHTALIRHMYGKPDDDQQDISCTTSLQGCHTSTINLRLHEGGRYNINRSGTFADGACRIYCHPSVVHNTCRSNCPTSKPKHAANAPSHSPA